MGVGEERLGGGGEKVLGAHLRPVAALCVGGEDEPGEDEPGAAVRDALQNALSTVGSVHRVSGGVSG